MGRDERSNPTAQQAASRSIRKIYDRFGRELAQGDLVIQLTPATIIWRVQRAEPSLHPQAPAGMVELELVAVSAVGVAGGQLLGDLIQVREASALPPPTPLPAPPMAGSES